MSLSVVVLAYNEAGSIADVVEELSGVLNELNTEYEILIVDDGSQDGTSEIADDLAEKYESVRTVHHDVNRGLGGGYRTGFVEARFDYLSFWPADGQFPAEIIAGFLPRMERVDLVLGTLPDRRDSQLAKFLSLAERILYRFLLGPIPKFQGVLMFRRKLLDDVVLRSEGRGWAVLMEFIIRVARGGYKVESVPTTMRPRAAGVSKVNNLPTIWSNLRQLFALGRDLRR